MPDLNRRSWFAYLLGLVGLRKITTAEDMVCSLPDAWTLRTFYEHQDRMNRFLNSKGATTICESDFRVPFTITRIDHNNTKTVTLNTDIG